MKKLLPLMATLAMLMSLLAFASPAAASYLDSACMKRYATSSLTYSQKVSRCTVYVSTLSKSGVGTSGTASLTGSRSTGITALSADSEYGFWGYEVGNAVFAIVIKHWYHKEWRVCAPVRACGWIWFADDVSCYTRFAYVVSIDIEQCRTWHYTGGEQSGLYYRESFGPVSEGSHSYLVMKDDYGITRVAGKN